MIKLTLVDLDKLIKNTNITIFKRPSITYYLIGFSYLYLLLSFEYKNFL